MPKGEDASFFLCKELIPGYLDGVTGEYATPTGYFVDEAEAEEFDKQFPYKEKLKLPGQLSKTNPNKTDGALSPIRNEDFNWEVSLNAGHNCKVDSKE